MKESLIRDSEYEDFLKIDSGTSVGILLSGGIDSTTLLHFALERRIEIIGLEFNYLGRTEVEKRIVKNLSENRHFSLYSIDYPKVMCFNNKDLKVEFRESNILYYTFAVSFGIKMNLEYIIGGQILNDWSQKEAVASPIFYNHLNFLLDMEFKHQVPRILMPFINLNKKEVVALGNRLGVHFDDTYSCPYREPLPCDVCLQCLERKEALDSLK